MKITIHDIQDNKSAEGWAVNLPPGVTLGEVFGRDEMLKKLNVVQVKANGRILNDWRQYAPAPDDALQFSVMPGAIPAAVIYALQILIAVISIVSFIVSLFQKPPKQREARTESPTYTFEGIQDTFEPGNPIPVIYGKQRKGGQVLMYYLHLLPDKSGLALNMLLSMGEGPVDNVDDVEINELSVSVLNSISIETRLGTSSQSLPEGFDTIRNTFHDGREITDPIKNAKEAVGATSSGDSSIVYRTVGHDVQQADIFVAALEGLTCIGKTSGKFYPQWSQYKVEIHDSGLGANECDNILWQQYTTRTVAGQYQRVYWDDFQVLFPYPSRWDIRLTWMNAACHPAVANPGLFTYRLWLQEVTELRGEMTRIDNEALLAIRATPTRELHGGRPNATAIVRGLKPDVYASVESFTNRWTQNPAWCVADYMTNSRYGMGAYISRSELDIQSFLDFATLADSLIGTCEPTDSGTFTSDCEGTSNFHTGDQPQGGGGFLSDPADECIGLWSKYDGQTQYGVCLARMCCPPLDNCWGVFSGEAACEWTEQWATISKIDTGSPVFGFVAWVGSGSTADNFSGYGMVYHHGSHTLSAVRWNNQSVNTYGTVLLTVTYCAQVGDFIDFLVFPAYTGWPSSRDWYFDDNTDLFLFAENSAGVDKVNTEVTDTSSLRFVKGGCGGLAEQGIQGVVVLTNPSTGDYHGVHLEEYSHECGLCYGGCGAPNEHCTCSSGGGPAIRHWDETCMPSLTRFNESTAWRADHLGGYVWPVGPG